MAKVQLLVWGFRCERCGHEWVPRREEEPRVCPSCKSPYWNRPRKDTGKRSEETEPGKKAEAKNMTPAGKSSRRRTEAE